MNSLGIQVITFWELDPLNHTPTTSEGTDPYGLFQKKNVIMMNYQLLKHVFLVMDNEVSKYLSIYYPLVNKHRPWKSPIFNGN